MQHLLSAVVLPTCCFDSQATAMMVVLPAVQAMGQHALVLLVSWPGCVSCADWEFTVIMACVCAGCV
jgi:hypothetical protein